MPTPEEMPIGGETVYAITKVDQERLVLTWGKQTGRAHGGAALLLHLGPRQSISPHTGVIAIFATRLLSGQPPVLYEDGQQTRDLCFVEDIARANLLAATTDALDGRPINVGSGCASTIADIARMVGERLGVNIEPHVPGEFRPGEMRHLISDISKISAVGYKPSVQIAEGIGRYLAWIKAQGDVRDDFAAAETLLKARRIVHSL